LGELGNYINGKAFKPSQWGKVGLPIIRIQNLTSVDAEFNYFEGELEPRYLVQDGDLLISWSATLGSYIWQRGPAALNQHIFKVEVNEEVVVKEFLHFLIQNTLAEMGDHTHGSTMKHITKGKFEALKVFVPPLAEQRRIVGRIKELMERVDEIRTLRGDALKEAEALHVSTCNEFIDTGWPTVKLGDVLLDTGNGHSVKPTGVESNGRVLSLSAVKNPILDLTATKDIHTTEAHYSRYGIKKGEVFVSRANTRALVGLSAIADADGERLMFPDLLIKLTPNTKLLVPAFLALVLRSSRLRDEIKLAAKGTSQSMVKISAKDVKSLTIPLPDLKQQHGYVETVFSALSIGHKLEQVLGSRVEAALPQSILRRAFAGEL